MTAHTPSSAEAKETVELVLVWAFVGCFMVNFTVSFVWVCHLVSRIKGITE